MAGAWLTFVYGVAAVCTIVEAAPSSSSSSSSSSNAPGGASAFAGDGGGSAYSGNGGAYAGNAGAGAGAYGGAGDAAGGFYFPYQQQPQFMPFPFDFNAAFQQHLATLAMLQAGFPGYQNPPYAFPGGQGGYESSNSLGNDGMASASAGGGDGEGISLRIGPGDFPASSGGNFGTFSSSSSSDVDGVTRHQSTVGVNDNGKIYFKTESRP